jgi:hypothetical protein
MTSALALVLPCPRCGARAGDPCVRRDGGPYKIPRSHVNRTPFQRCGTYAGYQQHKKAGEAACDDCAEASRRYAQEYRNRNPKVREKDIALLRARREATRLLIERHRDEFRQLLNEVAS